MPKAPAKAETKPPEEKVEIIPSETPQPKPAAEIEIDASTGKPVEPTQSQVDISSLAEEIRKERAANAFLIRQNEKMQKELAERISRIESRPQPGLQPEKPQESEDEYGPELDLIAQQNWKKGVGVIAEKKAEAIAEKKFKALMEEQNQRQQVAWDLQNYQAKLERSKSNVIQRTPNLNDESSEEYRGYYQTYSQMLAEDPDLLRNPYSPELVEHRWRLTQEQAKSPQELESERLKRIAGGATPISRPISGNQKTIKLTEDELEICRKRGISPSVYAQMKEADFKQGVTA